MFTETFMDDLATRISARILGNLAPTEVDRLMDVRKAATYLGCSVSALRQAKCKGQVPYTKRGKRLMFDRKRLDQYIEENTI